MSIVPLITYNSNNDHEIDSPWYQNVGLAILYNFFLYSITPNLSGFVVPIISMYLSRYNAEKNAIDQLDYNNLRAGPDLLQSV